MISSVRLIAKLVWLLILLIGVTISKVNIDFDPYKELGVPKHATQKEIRTSYKKLALKYHPDRQKTHATDEEIKASNHKMGRINDAFKVLGSKESRDEYDRQPKNSRQGFNIFRQTNSNSKDDGMGILLTSYNAYNLLYRLTDQKPWLIYAFEEWNHQSKSARPIFEDACSKLQGIARCGKFNANRQSSLVSEFGIRRVPHFIVYYNDYKNNKQYKESISWKTDLKPRTLVNSISKVLPNSCKLIYDLTDIKNFFDISNYYNHKKSFNHVKSLIFSDAQSRKKPHILLEYLANKFSDSIDFSYHFIETNSHRKKQLSYKIAESIGLYSDDLEPPEMYVFRSPLILKNIIQLMTNSNINKEYTLEDMGIYRISLESDVSSMTQFVLQYSTPLIPKIDSENIIDFCYLGNDGKLDESRLCFVFGVLDESQTVLERVLTFGQYLLANIEETIQFGWINCMEQSNFCKEFGLNPSSKTKFKFLSLWMNKNRYQLYNDEFDTVKKIGGSGFLYENDNLVKNICEWIEKLQDSTETPNQSKLNIKWKIQTDIGFPTKTKNWKDDLNTWILSPIESIFGFGADVVGTGASFIGTAISYVLQFGMLFLFMFVLFPMIRAMS